MHTAKELLTNRVSEEGCPLKGCQGQSLVLPTESQTPTPLRFSSHPKLLQTPRPNFNHDGWSQNIKGYYVFPKANLAGLPSRRLPERGGQQTPSLRQPGQFPSSERSALFLMPSSRSLEVQRKTDAVGTTTSSCLPSSPAPLLYNASPLSAPLQGSPLT